MKSKIAVITGATGGIGIEICKYLLQNGYWVLAACRHFHKGEQLREVLKKAVGELVDERLCLFDLDLLSFRSVDHFTNEIRTFLEQENNGIALLINNAGIIAPRFEVTEDGYESSLQVNYLSPRRLTEQLLPHLDPSGKIINTVSCTIQIARPAFPGEIPAEQQRKTFISLKNYSHSKLLLALYTIRLHQRLNGRLVCGADPGIVDTGIIAQHRWYDPLADLFFRPLIKRPQEGAVPVIRAIEYSPSTAHPAPLLFKGKKAVGFPRRIQAMAATFAEPEFNTMAPPLL